MAALLSRAVRDRQKLLPRRSRSTSAARAVQLRPRRRAGAHERARRSGKPHNRARVTFVKQLLGQLAAQLAGGSAMDPERAGRPHRRAARVRRRPARAERPVAAAEPRAPAARPVRPAVAAGHRRPRTVHTGACAAGPGPPGRRGRRRTCRCWTRRPSCSAPTRSRAWPAARPSRTWSTPAGRWQDSGATGMMSAEQLAARWSRRERVRRSVAEHAATDREWTYGHVVVDEAQELAPMAWRLLMRRCPTRSMTIVGDLAQTGALGRGVVLGRDAPAVRGRPGHDRDADGELPDAGAADGAGEPRCCGRPGRTSTSRSRPGRPSWAPVLTAVPDVLARGARGRTGRAGPGRRGDARRARPARAARRGGRGGRAAARRPGRGADRRAGQGPGVRRGAAAGAGGDRRRVTARRATTSTSRSPGPPSACTCCTRGRLPPGFDEVR